MSIRLRPRVAALLASGACVASLAWPGAAEAQIEGVSELCRERPPATGAPLIPSSREAALRSAAPSRAGSSDVPGPAADLYCIDLLGTERAGDARGVVELGRAASPFGVAVTADGHHVHDLTAWIAGLPDPSTLGPFAAYVAWATPLTLDPVVPLGPVENGENRLGEVAFNKYLIWVTAEASADASERAGPLVLRGRSPSSLMEPHDLLAQAPSAAQAPGPGPARDPAGEVGRAEEPPRPPDPGAGHEPAHDDAAWSDPPMYPGIPMLPGMLGLRPRVAPWLPPPPPLESIPEAVTGRVVDLPDGGTLDLEAGFVRRNVAGRETIMLAFNGQHPGPLIRVHQNTTVFVNFTNRTPGPTTVHWHGVRLDNRFDGVPGVTQPPVEPGETFRYRVFLPDAGVYWYHPHHREDFQQELGLYGNLLVRSPRPDHYGPAHRDEVLILDDLLLDERGPVPFGESSSNYMLMGRFGNILLVNGEPGYELDVERGEVVRFHLTNASNTRTLNLSFRREGSDDPLPMKVIATDVGRFEREEFARSAVLAPAERYVVHVRFPEPGSYRLVNRVQGIDHRRGVFLPESAELGTVRASSRAAEPDLARAFETLREHPEARAEIDAYRDRFDDAPAHELVLSLEVSDLPAPIEQSMLYDWIYFNPVEWTGTMPMMNWATSGREIRWVLRDPHTGAANEDIAWRFRVGDVVKIRLHNDRSAFHAMQHPLHIHGQRFLVLSRNGVPTANLAWKDTVLLPTGSTTDLLLELSNPGRWMVHCHIAEHLESGMKFVLQVEP